MPLSFAFGTFCFCILHFAFCPLLFGSNCSLSLEVYSFAYSLLFHSLSFGGSTRSFSMSVCFNSRFLTFLCIVFCPLPLSFAFGTFRSLPFGSLLVLLFSVVSFAVFWGQSSLFFNVCLFQQRFSYLFYIVFCPLPFAVCYLGILLFALWKFTRFFILCCIIRCLFGAVFALFQCLFVSTVVSLPFLYCFLPLCPFPLLLKHFALCPFQFYKQPFALYFPPFVVFFLFCVWDSPFALLLTAICCKNLLLDKKFSKNKKSLEIVIKTFDNT